MHNQLSCRFCERKLQVSLTFGVVWKRVIFHLSPPDVNFAIFSDSHGELLGGAEDSRISSEMTGMLLKLTVSARDTMLTANVAFNNGSSKQGNARRAAVGYETLGSTRLTDTVTVIDYSTYLKLRQCIVLLLIVFLPRGMIISHHSVSEFGREGNGQLSLGASR